MPGARRTLVLILLAAGAAYFFVDPARFPFMPRCLFRWLTGWSCPACGMQRAAHALLHGRVAEAVGCNFFLLFSVPCLLLLAADRWLLPPARFRSLRAALRSRCFVAGCVAATVLWWVARNALGI